MADFPIELRAETLRPELIARLARVVDAEGKIPRALDSLGSLAGRDVVLLGGGTLRSGQLEELGAHLQVLDVLDTEAAVRAADGDTRGSAADHAGPQPAFVDLPDESADAIVTCWTAFRGPSPAEAAEADRVLRSGGRLLVLHDYGRDEASQLWPEAQPDLFAWSRRDGWFLRSGFKIRVVHCWWTFDSVEEARALLTEVAGEQALPVVAAMKRPRLSYNVAVYHRTKGDEGGHPPGASGDGVAAAGSVAVGSGEPPGA